MNGRRPHVLIIGAGFGGLTAARRLARAPVDVTLVDRRNHHIFQPLLYQVATAALSPADIARPIRSIMAPFKNVRVLLDQVVDVDKHARTARFASGRSERFDYLIVATGARHSYFGRDHWSDHAPGLKSIEDATEVRRKILLALEHAETETDEAARKALLTFVVIGGGPTGIEMAGAIAELARRSVSEEFRHITPHCSRVILVEAGPRLLPAFPDDLSAAAKVSLEELGVEVILGQAVTAIDEAALAVGATQIAAKTVVWAAGVQASSAAQWLQADRDPAGRVKVGQACDLLDAPGIYVVGDTAHYIGPDGRPLPGIAPVAKQQGRYVATRIINDLRGRYTGPFHYRHFGNLATIGRRRAVIDFGRLRITGLPAWLLWSVAHVYFLVGFRNRLAVGASLAWNYLTFARHARLITGEYQSSAAQQPAE
ncbi:NAD(P)/FAD-dependent oxidoreductase [Sphingomonas jaspsi]|uniref:NAD(P)/FAD-dependent oxidoreductase n=1 Tax=Sphingomonas jaspsi TaxID=392409 RepID=UPI0004BC8B18|nr:NAD(P)/FAD-dependent oxidoreductase [Sphingomonas jaspsi]